MNKGLELRDELYYSDLIFEIKNLAGFDIDVDVDFKLYESIAKRRGDIIADDEQFSGLTNVFALSPFTEELFGIVKEISKRANTPIKNLTDISKYPQLVLNMCIELEKKDLENHLLINLNALVGKMGCKHAFSLGEDAEQCVCLNKVDDIWEVYIIERGMKFEKDTFEDCFDACLQVIHHLADSKQMYCEIVEKFTLVRKLKQNK